MYPHAVPDFWDVIHHLYGNPIVPFEPASSAGCASCDTVLAVWFFAGVPNVFDWFRRERTSPLNAG